MSSAPGDSWGTPSGDSKDSHVGNLWINVTPSGYSDSNINNYKIFTY